MFILSLFYSFGLIERWLMSFLFLFIPLDILERFAVTGRLSSEGLRNGTLGPCSLSSVLKTRFTLYNKTYLCC